MYNLLFWQYVLSVSVSIFGSIYCPVFKQSTFCLATECKLDFDNVWMCFQLCRLERISAGVDYRQELLTECPPIFVSENCSPPSDSLVMLISLCGGKVTKLPFFWTLFFLSQKVRKIHFFIHVQSKVKQSQHYSFDTSWLINSLTVSPTVYSLWT